jgi:geranylgeranyl diphosphate synthase type II
MCHRIFGEAIAILAGDSLMTRSYQVLSELPGISDSTRLAIVREIAYATGTVNGMIGGQVADLESEGKNISAAMLDYIHRSKTGALLAVCARSAALVSGSSPEELESLTEFGRKIGLAFQIIDDILDLTASSNHLGKTAGKDEKVKKATYPALYGVQMSRVMARELIDAAIGDLRDFGACADPLRGLARFVLDRQK